MNPLSAQQPPWQVFPYPWGSMGYRMGRGEEHWQKFTDWFQSLDPANRANFAAEHPEPADWRHFYEYICLERNDEEGWDRLFPLIQANWRGYQSAEYGKGLAAEAAGDLSVALDHYKNADQHGDFQDVAVRYERLRRLLRCEPEAEPVAAAVTAANRS